jgi:hypothetical protein
MSLCVVTKRGHFQIRKKFVVKTTSGGNWNLKKQGFCWFVLYADCKSGIVEGWKIQLEFAEDTSTVDTGQVALAGYICRHLCQQGTLLCLKYGAVECVSKSLHKRLEMVEQQQSLQCLPYCTVLYCTVLYSLPLQSSCSAE